MNREIESVVTTAEKYIGTKEHPAGSNNVIFNTHYYGHHVSGPGYPWCAVFVWDIFRESGFAHLFYGGEKTASCTVLMEYAKQNSLFHSSNFRRGDIVFFNWDGKKNVAQHTGIITDVKSGSILTIEGNSSVGNDSNGGEVMRRTRTHASIIGVYRPEYLAENKDYEDSAMSRYNTLAEIPDYAREPVLKLITSGVLRGSGEKDENGFPEDLDLSEDMLRMIVILDRVLN